MAPDPDTVEQRPTWFVGAAFGGGTKDQTDRFIREGVWEHRFKDRYLEAVKSIQVDDRIAIKSTYVRKHDLPFDNRGHSVSVMAIKAVGVVKDNPNDGRRLTVDWERVKPHREWYFYTYMPTVWRVIPHNYASKSLINFAFEAQDQDIDKFRNFPYWRDRFGDNPTSDDRFPWISFYSGFADGLLDFRHDRSTLLAAIDMLPSELPKSVEDRFADGTSGRLRDICPFTTMGIFNRGLTWDNRINIARGLAELLGMEELDGQLLESLAGIPVLNNQRSWFFPDERERDDDHIDALWRVFADALQYADESDEGSRASLIESFNDAVSRKSVGRRLTQSLYWIRPHTFVSLDRWASAFLEEQLGVDVPKGKPDGETYLDLCEELQLMFTDESLPVHSFPELSAMAWDPADEDEEDEEDEEDTASEEDEGPTSSESESPYSVDDIVGEGCFLERDRLETILERWRVKKNLILQGPPGTGKTWLAKKLAFALIGSRSPRRVRPLQFHPNLSYEDFVRGWRPSGGTDGRLDLVDGPFLTAVENARNEPARDYVVVIEEVNRGNPAQIFGEMLTLLEADKRTPDEALALSYPRNVDERVHIPDNLYVVGTMNVADRSLALVDLALRRRFAFFDLEPVFGDLWRSWVSDQCGLDGEFLANVERRLTALNQTISDDDLLGPQFRVGHSVVTPSNETAIIDPVKWFTQVVETEIGPLLDEYWFDATDRARSAKEALLKGFGS